jgi:hypothetical protein
MARLSGPGRESRADTSRMISGVGSRMGILRLNMSQIHANEKIDQAIPNAPRLARTPGKLYGKNQT